MYEYIPDSDTHVHTDYSLAIPVSVTDVGRGGRITIYVDPDLRKLHVSSQIPGGPI